MPGLQRNLQRVEEGLYDIIIVGGGVVGLSIAEDAASRGFRVLVLERGDFAAETSSGCFRLVHGGMRYLQHLDLSRMFASVREQKILRERAPHLVRPCSFLIPCYGRGKEGRWLLEAGMTLYELLCLSRNSGVPKSDALRRHVYLSREDFLRIAPGIALKNSRGEALSGAMRFYDCQMLHADRLAFSIALSACRQGAGVLNYAEVEDVEYQPQEESRFVVSVRDVLSGKRFSAAARSLVNATGPWASGLLRKWFGEDATSESPELSQRTMSKGFQIVLPEIVAGESLAVSSAQEDAASVVRRGKRNYFLVPWRGLTLAGTTDDAYSGEPGNFSVDVNEVQELLGELKRGYTSPQFSLASVKQVFGGLLPVETYPGTDSERNQTRIRILRDDVVFDQKRNKKPIKGLLTVVGVKYTTCRALAEEVVDRISTLLDRPIVSCRTASFSLFGSRNTDPLTLFQDLRKEFHSLTLPEKAFSDLITLYGFDARDVLGLALERNEPEPVQRLLAASVLYAARQESARSVSDVVFRRTFLGCADRPNPETAHFVSSILAEELSWSRIEQQNSEKEMLGERRFAFLAGGASE